MSATGRKQPLRSIRNRARRSFSIRRFRAAHDSRCALQRLAIEMKGRRVSIRLSRAGVVLVGIYVFLTAVAMIAASGTDDPKGTFVFLQLPVVLQMALITELLPGNLIARFANLSWTAFYILIWPPTALLLYAIGSAIGHASSANPATTTDRSSRGR